MGSERQSEQNELIATAGAHCKSDTQELNILPGKAPRTAAGHTLQGGGPRGPEIHSLAWLVGSQWGGEEGRGEECHPIPTGKQQQEHLLRFSTKTVKYFWTVDHKTQKTGTSDLRKQSCSCSLTTRSLVIQSGWTNAKTVDHFSSTISAPDAHTRYWKSPATLPPACPYRGNAACSMLLKLLSATFPPLNSSPSLRGSPPPL